MIGRLKDPIELVTAKPWVKDFRFWIGRTKSTPAVVSSATGLLRARGCGTGRAELAFSAGAGTLNVVGGTVQLRASGANMALAAGTYDLEVTATLSDATVRVVRGTVEIVGPI